MRRTLAVLALLLVPTSALAQTDPGYVEKNDASGQNMVFRDDPLAALPLGDRGSVIATRPSGARMGLLRPRTTFVQEMLKSVEAL